MTENNNQNTGDSPMKFSIFTEFASLDDAAIITESGLATLFHRHPISIKRAVERGELPPPTKLMGKPIWTAGSIRCHIEQRLEAERHENQQFSERIKEHQA